MPDQEAEAYQTPPPQPEPDPPAAEDPLVYRDMPVWVSEVRRLYLTPELGAAREGSAPSAGPAGHPPASRTAAREAARRAVVRRTRRRWVGVVAMLVVIAVAATWWITNSGISLTALAPHLTDAVAGWAQDTFGVGAAPPPS